MLQALYRKLAVRGRVSAGPGLHVGVGSRLWSAHGLDVGAEVYIGKWCTLEVDGTIGDHVLIANSVGIVGRDDHDLTQIGSTIKESTWIGDRRQLPRDSVRIGSDVWIGFGSVILSGVSIGTSSVIAAGSVVASDIPQNCIAAGNPARVMKERFTPDQLREHWHALRARGVRLQSSDQPGDK